MAIEENARFENTSGSPLAGTGSTAPNSNGSSRTAAVASLAAFLRISMREVEERLATDREGIIEEIREANRLAKDGEIPAGPGHCTSCDILYGDTTQGREALASLAKRAL